MSIGDECPECSGPLGAENLCRRCGWKSDRILEAEKAVAVPDDARRAKRWEAMRDDAQCARGKTFGPRCPFAAGGFPNTAGASPGYCTWHSEVLRDPRVDVFDEFARFCAKLRGPDDFEVLEAVTAAPRRLIAPRYCTLWTHYMPGELWDAMHGVTTTLPAPRACRSPSCPYADPGLTDADVAAFREAVRTGGWDLALRRLVKQP